MERFLTYYAKQSVKRITDAYNAQIQAVKKVLESKNEAKIETAIAYQTKGADFARKSAMASVESYIASVPNMPLAEQKRIRQQAWDGCDNEYIAKLLSVFGGCNVNLEKDVVVTSRGEWQLAPHVIEEIEERNKTTLTEEQEKDLKTYKQFLKSAKELSKRGYTIRDSVGNDILTSFLPLNEENDVNLALDLIERY